MFEQLSLWRRISTRVRRYDWAEIQRYYDEGHTVLQCCERFGFTPHAWGLAVARGEVKPRKRGHAVRPEAYAHPRYDWAAVQAYHDAGHGRRETTQHFGFCPASWKKAVDRGALSPRPRRSPIEHLSQMRSREYVKRRLLQAGILENRCDECGIREWRGKPISIQIDHRNGVRHDHRLENLRMLCPNCHSQTETYGAKNKNRLKRLS